MKYILKFRGRKIGSIGFSDNVITRSVEAASKEAARMMAYDTHEHIWGGPDCVYVTEDIPRNVS